MLSFILDFPKALLGFARVKEIGAIKYDFDNWKKGGKPDREYLDAALRHMTEFKSGEEFADDTGCHHLAHAAWNLFALIELNVDEVYDPKRFAAMCDYWRMEREKRESPNIGYDELGDVVPLSSSDRDAVTRVVREGR